MPHKNFTERINKLEALFSNADDHACRVVTFDQSIRIKEHRKTYLAEDFTDQTEYYKVFLRHNAEEDAHIGGYLSHDQVLILLELPRTIRIDNLLSSISNHSVLRIELDRPNVQYDEHDPLNCWAAMYRIEGNAFHARLLYDKNDDAHRAYLAVDWKDRLKVMLGAQVQ